MTFLSLRCNAKLLQKNEYNTVETHESVSSLWQSIHGMLVQF